MNVFFNMRPDEVTEKLNLVQEIQDALTGREGVLGMLLTLAEKADRQEYDGMGEEAEALSLSVEDGTTGRDECNHGLESSQKSS